MLTPISTRARSMPDDEAPTAENGSRKCRDVATLLAFVAFWAGMFFIAAEALERGDPRRVVFGVDSYGNVCGANNGDGKPDLSLARKLHFIDVTDVKNGAGDNILKAKRVCLSQCPGIDDTCTVEDLAQARCLQANKFVCPYYRISMVRARTFVRRAAALK